MVREELYLRNGGDEVSILSRSSKGGNLYIVSITQDGTLRRADGVMQEATNFHIDPVVNDKVFLG